MKPWLSEIGGPKLDAYLGAFGVKTSRIETTEEMIFLAAKVYEIEPASIEAMAKAIEGLGKAARKSLASKNIPGLFPEVGAGRFGHKKARHSNQALVDDTGHVDAEALLRKVVGAVIAANQQHILYEFPDVLAYFGAKSPGA